MKLFQVISFLVAIWATLKEHFNIEELSTDGLKASLGRFKDLFGFTRITPERADKFFETAEIVKEMGGIDALHEGLTEMKKAGLLSQFTNLYDEKEGVNSAGGLERSQDTPIIDINSRKVNEAIQAKGGYIVEVAKAEIGQTELPANSNITKYGEWFGFQGVAWCAIFVSWVYAMAKLPLGNLGWTKGFASVILGVAHFEKTGEITTEPQAGDIVFFDWNKDKRWDHVGIFVRWIDRAQDVFETIEGNTSATNQSNGGQVQLRERTRRGSYAVKFAHPKVLD